MHLSLPNLSVLVLALAASSSVALSYDNTPHKSLGKSSTDLKARQIGRGNADRAGPARLDNGRAGDSAQGNLSRGDQLRQLLEGLGNNGPANGLGGMDHTGAGAGAGAGPRIIIIEGGGNGISNSGHGNGRGRNRGGTNGNDGSGRGRGGRQGGRGGQNRGGMGRGDGNGGRGGRGGGKDNLGVGAGGDASATAAVGTDASAIIDASATATTTGEDPSATSGVDASATDASAIDASATSTAVDASATAPSASTASGAAATEKKGKVQAKVRHGVESRRRGKRDTSPHA